MKSIFLLASLLAAFSVLGQRSELFDTTNSDIADNDLLSITIDKNGKRWIGTNKSGLIVHDSFGLMKYQCLHLRFRTYYSPIFTDGKGNIWVIFSNPDDRIAKYDGTKWTVYSSKDLSVESLSVIAITQDFNGDVYFGGVNTLIKYDGVNWSKIKLPKRNLTIRTLDINLDGSIAVGHNKGLLIRKKGKWKSYSEKNSELRLSVVRAVKWLSTDKLVVGYGGGYGDGGFSVIYQEEWTHFNKESSKVQDHMVRDIEISEDGTLWMATNNGVIKVKDSEITPILFREGMYKNTIRDIAIDGSEIWIATNFGLIKMK